MSIELNQLVFSYPNAPTQPVLDIEHWSVASGEQVFLQGASGSGKSTLLNIINGLLSPTSGQAQVLEQRLDQLSSRRRDRFRANHIGCIFQQFNLIPYLNAVDNIRLGQQFSQRATAPAERIHELLEAFHIADNDWQKPVAQLSIGQQQRIAIARAMINQPEILIADEPSSALDQQNRDRFIKELTDWVSAHNMTLVFVSHDVTLAPHFHRVDTMSEINRAGHQ